jgi:uncharacterized protein YbjT (DUF2867 family)
MAENAVLVIGATGYVGGRLVPKLLACGYRVKALGRSMEKLACRPWAGHPNVELVRGDVLDQQSLNNAVKGCRAAFYLVHSMIAQKRKFADADRVSAHNMVNAAEKGGLEQIIYLGGLGDIKHHAISKHLLSRHEVGEILQAGSIPATVLRAAMIIGSGSASFEILRYLVERLPVMITPRWVHTPSQPIAIGNVIEYLVGCLTHPETRGETFDIGGPDILNYKDLIHIFAEEALLPKRRVIRVPVLTPHLSALWIHLVTPVPQSIAIPLTEGLSVPTTCRDNRIQKIVPQKLLTCREAIRLALDRILQDQVDTCWLDAGEVRPPEWANCGDAEYAGGTILSCGYRIRIQATPAEIWKPVVEMGGTSGYYYGTFLWRLRGYADRLLGGLGSCGRRGTCELLPGDTVDYFRVQEVIPPERLMLVATMKVPGEAVLDIQLMPIGDALTDLQLTARFLPRGVGGMVYWYAFYPFHRWLFSGMLKAIAETIGKPVAKKPEKVAFRLHQSCALPPDKRI